MRNFHWLTPSFGRIGVFAMVPMLVMALAACSPPDSGNEPNTTATGGTDEGGSGNGGEGETHIVHLVEFAFDTPELTIAPGDTVLFVNDDTAPHTASHGENGELADGAEFDIELAEEGSEGEVTLEEAGTYNVTCTIHPEMNMTITVEG